MGSTIFHTRDRWLAAGLAVSFLFLLGVISGANDSAVQGVGGALSPMKEHPSIRMLAERVSVDLTPERAEVDCSFTFKNTGRATLVRMGFPEWASGDVGLPSDSGVFSHFSTSVDGTLTPTRIEGLEIDREGWQRWRVKTVRFAAGQQRSVRVRYGVGVGDDIEGGRFFQYRLDTGASWKGPIGHVEVVVRLRRFSHYWSVHGIPAESRRAGDTLTWQWKNVEPGVKVKGKEKCPGRMEVYFTPGYRGILFNGGRVSGYGDIYSRPELRGTEVWGSLADLAQWAHANLEWNAADRSATLWLGRSELQTKPDSVGRLTEVTLPAHSIWLRPGVREATVLSAAKMKASAQPEKHELSLEGGKGVRLRHAPYIKHGRLFVPVNEIVTLLGGTARFDKKTGTTYLTLPEAKAASEATFRYYEGGKWQVSSQKELISREEYGVKGGHQPWRNQPAQIARVEAMDFLPEELRQGEVAQEEHLERVGEQEPAIVLRKGNAAAEYFVLQQLDKAASVRLVVDGKEKAVFILEKPFGNWWYIGGIQKKQTVLEKQNLSGSR